ncbi:hypothetical protein KP509_05G014800 [Ceratopteris richardii]|uniref:RNA polymerase II C-terminal domain phosphatase-like n=1 Tax=Ceratopteris richardii TaxID=49495 RepID=A0A8T2URW3_CERRI|nr:hypothetical protein KP509_05G014800 [Ceratopteris richardii]
MRLSMNRHGVSQNHNPDFRQKRFLHFIGMNTMRQPSRSGLLGVAPSVHIARGLFPSLYHPPYIFKQANVIKRCHPVIEMLQACPPSDRNFMRLAPLKKTKHESKLISPCINKRFKFGKTRMSSFKVHDKVDGVKCAPEQTALKEKIVLTTADENMSLAEKLNEHDMETSPKDEDGNSPCTIMKENQTGNRGFSDSNSRETEAYELEEGEIPPGSQVLCNVDNDDLIHAGEISDMQNDIRGLDCLLNTGRSVNTSAVSDNLSSGVLVAPCLNDKQNVVLNTCCENDALLNEKVSLVSRKFIECEPLAEASNISQSVMEASKTQDKTSLDDSAGETCGILVTTNCLDISNGNTNSKGSLYPKDPYQETNLAKMQDNVGSHKLLFPTLESIEHGKDDLGIQDSRREFRTVTDRGNLAQKRKSGQLSLPDIIPKRFGTERDLKIKSHLSNDLMVQEAIDMEIDSNQTLNASEIIVMSDSHRNGPLQLIPSSGPSFGSDSLELSLRLNDGQEDSVHDNANSMGSSFVKSSGLGKSCEADNIFASDRKQDSRFYRFASREEMRSWEGLHLGGMSDDQCEVIFLERARRMNEQKNMLSARKLCLVLDLDHTLLNSAKFSDMSDNLNAALREMEMEVQRKSHNQPFKKDLISYPKMGMWTKLRPGVWDFLLRASELFELHVYTMGNRTYATEMAKLLDPTGALFAGRVISRGDDTETTNSSLMLRSKDLDGVLGLESAVIIIDDSEHVWPHHKHNLLVVERYMYFPSSRRQFGLPGPSLLEIGHDERASGGMLASVLKVIEKIHQSFFSNELLDEVDVRNVLMREKRNILAGCKILFSRVFPQDEAQPHLHPLWDLAEQFGATCTTTVDDDVTHVVALSRGTDKVKWALRTGKFCVSPSWLEASAVLYRRSNEKDFPVPPC